MSRNLQTTNLVPFRRTAAVFDWSVYVLERCQDLVRSSEALVYKVGFFLLLILKLFEVLYSGSR